MKANELMIGDWVRCTDPKPFQLKIIDEIDHVACGENCFMVDIADLQPIPLTKEILEKNGFRLRQIIYELNSPKYDWHVLIGLEDGRIDCCYVRRMDDGYLGRNIKFVHELQHALRLCGIEKEIEL